jgi:hypothetical protein
MVSDVKHFIITDRALKVHGDMNIINLATTLMNHTNFTMMQYHVSSFIELSFLSREWYDLDALQKGKTKKDLLNVLDNAAEYQDQNKDLNSQNAELSILRFQDTKLGQIFFDPNSITSLFFTNDTYSLTLATYRADVSKISNDNSINAKFLVKLFNLDGSILGSFVFQYFPKEKLIIRTLDSFEAKFRIDSDNKFLDVKFNYKFPSVNPKPKEKTKSDKFGTLDFETYTDHLGEFIVYAAAYAYMEKGIIINKSFYKPKSSNKDVIIAMILDLCQRKFNGIPIYSLS